MKWQKKGTNKTVSKNTNINIFNHNRKISFNANDWWICWIVFFFELLWFYVRLASVALTIKSAVASACWCLATVLFFVWPCEPLNCLPLFWLFGWFFPFLFERLLFLPRLCAPSLPSSTAINRSVASISVSASLSFVDGCPSFASNLIIFNVIY